MNIRNPQLQTALGQRHQASGDVPGASKNCERSVGSALRAAKMHAARLVVGDGCTAAAKSHGAGKPHNTIALAAMMPEHLRATDRQLLPGDVALLQRVRVHIHLGEAGAVLGTAEHQRLQQQLTNILKPLFSQGLTGHERLLLGQLEQASKSKDSAIHIEFRKQGSGSSDTPYAARMWFGPEGLRMLPRDLLAAREPLQVASAWQVFKHELSHVVDWQNAVPGYLDDSLAEHRRVYSELRANLWACDFDHEAAAAISLVAYYKTINRFIDTYKLHGMPPVAVYEAAKILSEQLEAQPASAQEQALAHGLVDTVKARYPRRHKPHEPGYAFPQFAAFGPVATLPLRCPQSSVQDVCAYRSRGYFGEQEGTFEWVVSKDGAVLGRTFTDNSLDAPFSAFDFLDAAEQLRGYVPVG